MLNVTIQNDGKIKLQSECSGLKELKFNVNLLLGVVQSMEIEEKANKNAEDSTVQTTYYLYLDKVENNNRLSTSRTLSKQLNISLENAKAIVDTAADGQRDILLDQSFDYNSINNVKDALESVGCTCKITSDV